MEQCLANSPLLDPNSTYRAIRHARGWQDTRRGGQPASLGLEASGDIAGPLFGQPQLRELRLNEYHAAVWKIRLHFSRRPWALVTLRPGNVGSGLHSF
jgi:hypothetical protein